ncbi:MAG: AMP-binding protein [Ignavibacteria bacterium]|nr:AMP-binding protein [Ignavibacteria bacterium]
MKQYSMSISEFIEYLEKLNFSLAAENGKLNLKGDKKSLSKDEMLAIKKNDFVINYIKEHKEEIIEYLSFSKDPGSDSDNQSNNISSIYRLSGLQAGMLFHGLYDETSGAYTEQMGCDLVGADLDIVIKSWEHILKHHTILRSGFYYDTFNVPVQCVYREVKLPVTNLDYSDLSPEEQSDALKKHEEKDREERFDFKSAPLMRVGLIRLSEDRHRMVWTFHHILFDGWSKSILMEEFLRTYEILKSGSEVPAAEVDRYEDYIRFIERIDKEKEEDYWRNYMNGVNQNTLLPFIGTNSQRNKGAGSYETLYIKLDSEITKRAEAFAKRQHLTINTLMQGVWSYLLHSYTNSDEAAYGVIVSGRPDELPGVEKRVGMYINTIPLHSSLRDGTGISEWLQEIQKNQVHSRQFQYTPLQKIQGWTGIKGDMFDTILVFENYPVSEIVKSKKWSLRVENLQMREQSNYPLTVIIGISDKITIGFSYNKELLEEEQILSIRNHFENVFRQIVGNEKNLLSEIKLITDDEEQRLLSEFNIATAEYPKDGSITDLFEEQAAKTPDGIALISEDQKLTYRELNERSNQLANYLQSKGVKEETLVPACMERSIDLIIAIFGILKAGGAYVPIDPDYPEERILFMTENTGAKILISSDDISSKLPTTDELNIIKTDKDFSEISKQPKDNLRSVRPDNLAYVIYTSGSTGKPKGVMIEHSG